MFLAAFLGIVTLAIVASPTAADAKPVWLCKPGMAANPCQTGLSTTLATPTGTPIRVRRVKADRHRKIDCFYVYPTVSDDPGANSDLVASPEERSIARFQAARFSRHCRVFAPMYRQATLTQYLSGAPVTGRMHQIEFRDVARAWRTYLRRYNHGRGVVLIGHSEGAFLLRKLIRKRIERRRSVRKRLVSAILLGGNVLVARKSGRASSGVRAGDFERIRPCRSARQLRCVIAYSSFDQPVPADSLYGRAVDGWLGGDPAIERVLCVNPTGLRGAATRVDSIYPTKPFAPDTIIGAVVPAIGMPQVDADTTWVEYRGAYRVDCSSADKANVLQVTALSDAPVLTPIPDPTWGLHLIDLNITLGNLVSLVGTESRAYAKRVTAGQGKRKHRGHHGRRAR